MSILSATGKRLPKRTNRRQQALLARKQRNLRRQAFIARRSQNDSSVNNQQKEKPTIIILYER